MSLRTITAQRTGDEFPPVSAQKDFGSNLQEAIEISGEEVIYAKYIESVVIDAQEVIRKEAYPPLKDEEGKLVKNDAGKQIYTVNDDPDVQGAVDAWTPSVGKAVASKEEKTLKRLDSHTLEEQEAMLEEVIARKKAEANG